MHLLRSFDGYDLWRMTPSAYTPYGSRQVLSVGEEAQAMPQGSGVARVGLKVAPGNLQTRIAACFVHLPTCGEMVPEGRVRGRF